MNYRDKTVKNVEITNLTKSYDDFIVLDEVNLHVEKGEIVGVLGPNGAGKSTLLRMCEGRDKYDSGRIECFGHDISIDKDIVKGNLGLVLQRPSFSSYSTVSEVIELFASINKPRVNPDSLSRKLGLEEKADVRIAKLSGGQRQRLGVLIGLMWGAGLLLLDEPTSELDPQARRLVWDLIRIIAHEHNSSVLMTTHQMEEAESLCDRVYIIDNGKIVEHGTPSQIIMKHCDDVIVTFSIIDDEQSRNSGLLDECEYLQHGHVLKCRKSVESLQDGRRMMKELLDMANLEILDIGIKRSNLEDVFIQLTGSKLRN